MDALLAATDPLPARLRGSEHEGEWRACADDVVHWLRTWVRTYDPRLRDPWLRFDPFPRQEEYMRWLEDLERDRSEGVAEKCRDVGFTWLSVAFLLHRWLFRPGFKGSVGSRKETLVDSLGDPDSILEKARMVLRRLPGWMLPGGYVEERHAMFCRFVNPENGATITGEAGDQIGRGGRSSIYFIDEAAFLERSEKVVAALSANAEVKVWVSTPNGRGNAFARLRHSGEVPVFTFRWSDDPRKGPKWYERKKRTLAPAVFAQEVDVDYDASVEGQYLPGAWIRAAIGLALVPSGRPVCGFDVAAGGANESALVFRRGGVVTRVRRSREASPIALARWAREECEMADAEALFYDASGIGSGIGAAFAAMDTSAPFDVVPVMVGDPPTDLYWEDGKTSRQRFANLKAELWGLMFARLQRTVERISGERAWDDDECLSLPQGEDDLVGQLGAPLREATTSGKDRVEPKDRLRARGVASPDLADALALTFAPRPQALVLDC